MPKNRREIDKEEKKQEVIEVAQQLFLSDGYYKTSMAQVAKSAGIAPNTIYWYFKNKNALFAEVISAMLAVHLQAFQQRVDFPFEENVLWALERLSETRPLAAPLHELMDESEEVARVHDNFHRLVKASAMQFLLRQGAGESDAENLVAIWEHVLEGLLLHSADETERKRVCDFLLKVTKKIIRDGMD